MLVDIVGAGARGSKRKSWEAGLIEWKQKTAGEKKLVPDNSSGG